MGTSTNGPELDNNIYVAVPGGSPRYRIGKKVKLGFDEWIARTNFDLSSLLVSDPGFRAASVTPVNNEWEQLDFSLRPESPAIGKAAPLTYTLNSGQGNRILVQRAGYFFDGYGVETGDQIAIGNAEARLVKVDKEKNELVLDRSVVWTTNAPVTLSKLRAGRSVGAVQRVSKGYGDSSAGPVPPKNLRLQVVP